MNTTTTTLDIAQYTSLFEKAAMFNMNGIQYLTAGRCDGAYTNFKQALKIMTQMTKDFERFEQNDDDDVTLWADELLPVVASPKTVPLPEDGCFYLYNHALAFCPPTMPTQCNIASCVAVLIFNTALAFHQRGRFPRALKLYAQVITILEVCDSDDDETHDFLQLVARNNHTQILSAMGQVDQVQEGLEDLCEMLPRVQAQAHEEPSSALFADDQDEILAELVLNLCCGSFTVVAAAA